MSNPVILLVTAVVVVAIFISISAVLFLTNRSVERLDQQSYRLISKSYNSDYHISDIVFFPVNTDV